MLGRAYRRGDTIIEVMLAFAIFALIAVSTTYLMNRSLSIGQRSLEITLVRQQVDAQAELLRYARDNQTAAWDAIRANLTSADTAVAYDTCPTAAPASAFTLAIDPSTGDIQRVPLTGAAFEAAGYHSRSDITVGSTPQSSGLWVTAVQVTGTSGATNAYDMYIRACWDSVGSSVPQTVSTIVRLYET